MALYGLLSWAFPFHDRTGRLLIDVFLFKSIMLTVGARVSACLLYFYFRQVTSHHRDEGLAVGAIWLAMAWALDLILLLPMLKIGIGGYFAQIGLRYLSLPISSITIGLLLAHQEKRQAA